MGFQSSDISSFDGSRTQDMMEDFDEEYTPENPTINEPTLRSITMVPGEVNKSCLIRLMVMMWRSSMPNSLEATFNCSFRLFPVSL